MALELSPEERQNWIEHRTNHPPRDSGGVGSKTPEKTKQLIVREYRRGKSIRRIWIEHKISRKIISTVLRERGLRP